MTPTITLDPRDAWAHARRIECYRYAKDLGVTEITEDMPKDLMVKRLKALGHPPPNVPRRPIGKDMHHRQGDTDINSHRLGSAAKSVVAPIQPTAVVDADDLLEQQWKQHIAEKAEVIGTMDDWQDRREYLHKTFKEKQDKSKVEMGWNEMRAELKARGIKLNRRWRMDDVKAILNGEDPSKRRQ